MASELTHLKTNVTDLTKHENDFPHKLLLSIGFQKQSHLWDDMDTYHTISTESAFEIHVVAYSAVWLEANGKLTLLKDVKTCEDLLDLIRLL